MEVDTIIFQVIGKLYLKDYNDVDFEVNGYRIKERLACRALEKYLSNHNVKVVLIVPISLLDREIYGLTSNGIEFKRDVEKIFKELNLEYNISSYDVHVIPSAYGRRYVATVDTIVSSIFMILLRYYLRHLNTNSIIKMIYEASSGHNLYTLQLREAFRGLILFAKLTGKDIDVFEAVSDPIIGRSMEKGERVKIHITKIDYRPSFTLPFRDVGIYKDFEGSGGISKVSGVDIKCVHEIKTFIWNGRLSKIFKELYKAYNALAYNTPLVFYYNDLVDLSHDIEKEKLVNFYEEYIWKCMKKESNLVWPQIYWIGLLNIFLSISMYDGIRNIIINKLDRKPPVSLRDLRSNFKDVYRKLGLYHNIIFLDYDVENLIDKSRGYKKKGPVDISLILNLMPSYDSEKAKRHFYAHSGIVGGYTIYHPDINGISYKEAELDVIREWLEKPYR